MTKHIRIENADGSSFKVRVRTYQKVERTLEGGQGNPDILLKTEELLYPTSMGTFMIHSSQYVVVDELT